MDGRCKKCPMTSRIRVEDPIQKSANEAKQAEQQCRVLDLHGHPVTKNQDQVLHGCLTERAMMEIGKRGVGQKFEQVEGRTNDTGEFLEPQKSECTS